MLIFSSAYVLLALASWSALAVPLSGFDNRNAAAQKRSLSSSNLMSRQVPGPEVLNALPSNADAISKQSSDSSTMDCNTNKGKDKDKEDSTTGATFPTGLNMNPEIVDGIGPALDRRGRRSMRRGTRTSSPESIFERDRVATPTGPIKPKPKHVTVGDILNHYYQQRDTQKRAERPRTSRDIN